MTRRAKLQLALVGLVLGLVGVQLASNSLNVATFVGDTLFVFDIVVRIRLGQVPHLDFLLHLGAMPYLLIAAIPVSDLVDAFLIAQGVFAVTITLAAFHVWRTRLDDVSGVILALAVIILVTAISSPSHQNVTLGVFYNRWAWATALVLVSLVFVVRRDAAPSWGDAILVGLLAYVLFSIKLTFFAGIVPAAVILAAVRGDWAFIGRGLGVFLLLLGLTAAVFGGAFWANYLQGLYDAIGNEIRPVAGLPLAYLLVGRDYAIFTLTYVAWLFLVLQDRGLGHFFAHTALALGFVFVQFQNFANVPLYMVVLLILAVVLVERRTGSLTAGIGRVRLLFAIWLAALGAVQLYPMALSTFQNAAYASETFLTLRDSDHPLGKVRLARTQGFRETRGAEFASEICETTDPADGLMSFAATLSELEGAAFILDGPTFYWLLSDAEPLLEGAPWNYGSLDGLEAATAVAEPMCPIHTHSRDQIKKVFAENGIDLRERSRTEFAIIYDAVKR